MVRLVMRRRLASSASKSTGVVGKNGKAQAVVSQQHSGLGRGALNLGPVPQRIEESATNRLAVGWNPTRPTSFFTSAPPVATNYLRGFTSSARLKAGLVPTVILSFPPEESKAQSDLPLMFSRMQESRKAPGWTTALPLRSVR
jgi:hypothetical protein